MDVNTGTLVGFGHHTSRLNFGILRQHDIGIRHLEDVEFWSLNTTAQNHQNINVQQC